MQDEQIRWTDINYKLSARSQFYDSIIHEKIDMALTLMPQINLHEYLSAVKKTKQKAAFGCNYVLFGQ